MTKNAKMIITLTIIAATLVAIVVVAITVRNKNINISPTPFITKEPTPSFTPLPTAVPSPTPVPIEEVVKEIRNNIKDNVGAVYLTGTSAGSNTKIDKIIEIAKKTQLNAVVIDIKEDGVVNYQSNVPEVMDYGSYVKYYNPEPLIKKLHENGLYVIGRLVCFRDTVLAEKRSDLAIKSASGKVWKKNGFSWSNPYNTEVWDYNIAIAKEAVSKGFDEIQFDYVRFPEGSSKSFAYGVNPPDKSDTISDYLKKVKTEITEVPISADIFAIVIESKIDGTAIGQLIEKVGMDIDYISPMIYPSHYANSAKRGFNANGVGQNINGIKFTAPDLKPYEVVNNALLKAKKKISAIKGYKAKVRPYLQAFTASYLPNGYWMKYGSTQTKAQIKAVKDAGYSGWIFWDPYNRYSENMFYQ